MSDSKATGADATVLLSVEGHVATVTISRPKVLNALNRETLDELERIFDELAGDDEVRVIVLTGAGEKAFVAGADIKEIDDLNRASGAAFSERGQRVFQKIEQHPKVIIAAVNGFALGGGCELAMACDVRVASENARFGQPEINLGIIPGYGGTQRLPRLLGYSTAKLLVLTGDMLDAKAARELRLVDRVVPEGSALKEATDLARAIAGKPPLAVQAIKEAIEAAAGDEAEGYAAEARLFGGLMQSDDKREGIEAFLEKRSPEWTGR